MSRSLPCVDINLLIQCDGKCGFTKTSSIELMLRRVDTQDCLIGPPNGKHRLVELGPSSALMGMAKKTKDFKSSNGGLSNDIDLQYLASTKDTKELSYMYEPSFEALQPPYNSDALLTVMNDKASDSVEPQPLSQIAQVPIMKQAAASIADVPLTAEDILKALIAQKLGKEFEQISSEVSLKALTGGWSV